MGASCIFVCCMILVQVAMYGCNTVKDGALDFAYESPAEQLHGRSVKRLACRNLDCGSNCICERSHSGSRVSLEGGKQVTVSELQIGEKVQSVSSDGRVLYSEVKAFLRKDDGVVTMFKTISTSLNKTISLTGNHLVYARKSGAEMFKPVYAEVVSTGDEFLVEESNELVPATVLNAATFQMKGVFAPLTKEGNIVVDGVMASCYGSYNHDVAHIVMTPLRWFPDVMEWIFGKVREEHIFMRGFEEIGRWMLPSGMTFQ